MAKATSVKKKIAIIGSGHIGVALARGLVGSGVRASSIIVSSPGAAGKSELKKLGVTTTTHNKVAARNAHWIFLAVKPAVVVEVLKSISAESANKAVVSLAAGVQKATLKKHAGRARVARIMPNLAIAVNQGVVGYLAGTLTVTEKQTLTRMLSGLGIAVQVKNDRALDALTLISGCGPGIVAFFIEALSDSARAVGIKGAAGELVAFQVFNGTIAQMGMNRTSARQLMKSVATKGGVTEAILNDLAKGNFKKDFTHALKAGHMRIKKLRK